mmetsp:Transcript_34424/g.90595  ORF Transcript_34424/g.90595 Transcript_34424/m.90595 type:complete len:263 (-) Transcript_34424:163-951(-)
MPNLKAAYMRKHGMRPHSGKEHSEAANASSGDEQPKSPRSVAAEPHPHGEHVLSWKQKRAQHVLERAGGGGRSRRNSAESFEGEGEKSENHLQPPSPAQQQLAVTMTAVNFTAKLRTKTWLDRRKEAFLAPHADRTERRSAEAEAAAAATAAAAAADTPRASPREKSWTQKRKETYLKRYGRVPVEPPPPDVAITAIAFAAALKRRSSNSQKDVAGGVGTGSGLSVSLALAAKAAAAAEVAEASASASASTLPPLTPPVELS